MVEIDRILVFFLEDVVDKNQFSEPPSGLIKPQRLEYIDTEQRKDFLQTLTCN